MRYEPNFDALVQRTSDSSQHGERVSLVVRILESADDARRRAHPRGQLTLTEPGLGAEIMDLLSHFAVSVFFFHHGGHLRIGVNIPAVQNLHGV